MFVVQPHLDDAVIGIGHLMAAVAPTGIVVTAFGGTPPRYPPLSKRPHDDICGFTRSDDVMRSRRMEDEHALQSLRWKWFHMGLLDSQYLGELREEQIRSGRDGFTFRTDVERIWAREGEPEEVWCPLGIAHQDHIWVREHLAKWARDVGVRLRVWAEPGYRGRYGQMFREAMAGVVDPDDIMIPWDAALEKLALMSFYPSQLHALPATAMLEALRIEIVGTWST